MEGEVFSATLHFRVVPREELAREYWDWDYENNCEIPAAEEVLSNAPAREVRATFAPAPNADEVTFCRAMDSLGIDARDHECYVSAGAYNTWQEALTETAKIIADMAPFVERTYDLEFTRPRNILWERPEGQVAVNFWVDGGMAHGYASLVLYKHEVAVGGWRNVSVTAAGWDEVLAWVEKEVRPELERLERYWDGGRSNGDILARRAAVRTLSAMRDPSAVSQLATAMGDTDPIARWLAAHALGRSGDTAAVATLTAALGDSDPDVRKAVAEALRKLGDRSAVPGLLSALGDPDFGVRVEVIRALGALGDPVAVPHLVAELSHWSSQIRVAAAHALGAIGDPSAAPQLIAALGDLDSWVRSATVSALGALGNPVAVPHLVAALGDEDPVVRSASTAALRALGGLADS